jgi:Domain of unknown function (DUF4124)
MSGPSPTAAAMLLAPMFTVALAAPPRTTSGTPSAATVYKCVDIAGVVYQDTPCKPGAEQRNFATDPPSLSVVPGTPMPTSNNATVRAARGDGGTIPIKTRDATGNVHERRFIRIGMSQAEVLQRIGRPDVDARNQHGKGHRWSYLPRSGDPDTITTVTLVDGRVAEVERKIVR